MALRISIGLPSIKFPFRHRHRVELACFMLDWQKEDASYCPECEKAEYPLDKALFLGSRQRMSSSVQELSVLCGASWKYAECEYLMKKILRRYCVSHETVFNTVFNKTTQIGKAASMESVGAQIKELEEDKKKQGEYFDNMEVCEEVSKAEHPKDPAEIIYIDLDGVLLNSRDNTKRMEGKIAVIWSKRELVKENTYSLVDKRLIGSFCDPQRYYWDITAELYKRSGGKIDKVKKRISAVYERGNKREEVRETILEYLDSDDVDGALDYISKLTTRFSNQRKIQQLKKLADYIKRNRHGIWYHGIWYKEARDRGISIGAGSADKAGDILICRRMKLRGMRWSSRGAGAVLAIRILVCNGEWDEFWQRYKAA